MNTDPDLTRKLTDTPAKEVEVFVQGILRGKHHCTIDLLFDWFGLVCFANKNKKCQLSYSSTADFKPVKQEVNGTMILSPLVFPGLSMTSFNSLV